MLRQIFYKFSLIGRNVRRLPSAADTRFSRHTKKARFSARVVTTITDTAKQMRFYGMVMAVRNRLHVSHVFIRIDLASVSSFARIVPRRAS